MAIAKLSLVNIMGEMQALDSVILYCLERGDFHVEPAAEHGEGVKGITPLGGENPYTKLLSRMDALRMRTGYPNPPPGKLCAKARDAAALRKECEAFCTDLEKAYSGIKDQISALRAEIEQDETALFQLEHIHRLDGDFDSLFRCTYLKLRIGHMPVDSVKKLDYYHDRQFLFLPVDMGKDMCWGIYFTPTDYAPEIDDIFSSLYFERIRVPDFVHGSPEEAFGQIRERLKGDKSRLEELNRQLSEVAASHQARFEELYALARFYGRSYDLRADVSVLRRNFTELFHITGFIEESGAASMARDLSGMPGVMVELLPPGSDKRLKEPTRLRNNWFAKPFEMFVDMYGLPSYHDVDPTPFVALTYCLLFGIMFGDLGQGLLLVLFGALLWRIKHMNIGRVINRIGIFSCFFGVLYGSVFGLEHVLDPFYQKVFGLAEKPLEVMAPSMTNVILVSAVALGVGLLLVSMVFNIVAAARRRDAERAFFSANGLAGFLFYSAVLAGAAMLLLAGKNVFGPAYVVCLLVIPLLLILFKEPLGRLARGASPAEAKPEDGFGNYLMVGFFELFEVVLSFFSNTMSFLRVGGFVLSHAGMMAVVLTLAEMAGGGAAGIVVMIIGNLFVMAMEGLIVGIQVLRLEFYEMFSRYFDGDGKPFTPAGVTGENTAY